MGRVEATVREVAVQVHVVVAPRARSWHGGVDVGARQVNAGIDGVLNKHSTLGSEAKVGSGFAPLVHSERVVVDGGQRVRLRNVHLVGAAHKKVAVVVNQ